MNNLMLMLKMTHSGVIPIIKQSRCKFNISLELGPQSWVSSKRLLVTPARVRNLSIVSLLCTDFRKVSNERAGDEVGGSHRQKERDEGKAKSHCGLKSSRTPTHRLLCLSELRSMTSLPIHSSPLARN